MIPKQDSSRVLMVVSIFSIIVVAAALFIAFGPSAGRNFNPGDAVQENTLKPRHLRQDEKQLAGLLLADSHNQPVLAAYRADRKFHRLAFGYEKYSHGRRINGTGGETTTPLDSQNRTGALAVHTNSGAFTYSVSGSRDAFTSFRSTGKGRSLTPSRGEVLRHMDFSSAQRIRKGKKIYLRTVFLAPSNVDVPSDPEVITAHPELTKKCSVCYLFYVKFE